MLKYKKEALPGVMYLTISALAFGYIFIAPPEASFSAFAITILTLPWSVMGVSILDHLHIYTQSSRLILMVIEILINFIIILFVNDYFSKSN